MATSRKVQTKTRRAAKRKIAKIKVNVKGRPERRTPGKVFFAIGLILLPLVVGVISTFIAASAMIAFSEFDQPSLTPSAWSFSIVWTILYILMGVASYLICKRTAKDENDYKMQVAEIVLYFVQLFFNFMWAVLFFRLGMRWFAFGWLVAMWLMIFILICLCSRNCKSAAWCLVPYILWCTFAMYLNIMIAILN